MLFRSRTSDQDRYVAQGYVIDGSNDNAVADTSVKALSIGAYVEKQNVGTFALDYSIVPNQTRQYSDHNGYFFNTYIFGGNFLDPRTVFSVNTVTIGGASVQLKQNSDVLYYSESSALKDLQALSISTGITGNAIEFQNPASFYQVILPIASTQIVNYKTYLEGKILDAEIGRAHV